MDKDWKLQRYGRKDYSDLVEFPVEIVGRDGVVRRYSFEDSVRLYQRRITFAPLRYRDNDLVDAEVSHCKSRIEQIRRSYYHRFGWGTPDGEPEPLEVFGDLAGELAAFVCRVFRAEGRPDVVITSVADPGGPVSTWYVVPADATDGLVLYVHRFDGEDGEAVRERFFTFLRSLEQAAEVEGDHEAIVAFHHTVDCGFVLTSRGSEPVRLADLRTDSDTAELEPTPWDDALEVIRRGDFQEGVGLCRRLVADQPFHRNAWLAGAVLSAALRRYYDAEDFALLGAAHFPDDAVLHQYAGLARYRLGRLDDAEAALTEAVRLAPELGAARFLLANVLVDRGRLPDARRLLAAAPPSGEGRRADQALERLGQWLRWRRVMALGAGAAFALGLVALLVGGWIGLVPVFTSVGVALAGAVLFRRQLEQVRARQRYDELSQGLRRVHRKLQDDDLLVS